MNQLTSYSPEIMSRERPKLIPVPHIWSRHEEYRSPFKSLVLVLKTLCQSIKAPPKDFHLDIEFRAGELL